MMWRRCCWLLLASVALASAAAQPGQAAVKAAFLAKFAAYVDWPARLRLAPTAPMTLCILGDDPFGRSIDDRVKGEQVGRHPLVVKRLPSAAGAEECQIAYVAGNAPRGTPETLRALQGKPVLTVTDDRAGATRGMIHFVVDGGRVRFLIDEAAAQSAGLTLNARLLAIALSVRTRH
jgi:hypothetical protein